MNDDSGFFVLVCFFPEKQTSNTLDIQIPADFWCVRDYLGVPSSKKHVLRKLDDTPATFKRVIRKVHQASNNVCGPERLFT